MISTTRFGVVIYNVVSRCCLTIAMEPEMVLRKLARVTDSTLTIYTSLFYKESRLYNLIKTVVTVVVLRPVSA